MISTNNTSATYTNAVTGNTALASSSVIPAHVPASGIEPVSFFAFRRIPAIPGNQGQAILRSVNAPTSGAGMTTCKVLLMTSLEPTLKSASPEKAVMPAKAGIQKGSIKLDSRLRGNERKRLDHEEKGF
jgi:hypothetical protein